MGAVGQSAYTATAEQQQRIIDIVDTARREIYGCSATPDRDRGAGLPQPPPALMNRGVAGQVFLATKRRNSGQAMATL